MSAWKKPSRMAWRRNERSAVRPSASRSWPAASSAAWSPIGMPSIHSSVSTRRAVRRQSTVGTRKPPSSGVVSRAMLSAISEMAAASSRMSISICDGVRQRLDHGDRAQPPRRRMEALDLAGGEEVAVEVALELLLDAGTQNLHRHVAAHAVVDHDGLVHLGDGGCGDRRAELDEVILQPAAELLLDGLARFRHGERRQLVLQVAQVAARAPDRSGRRGWRGTGRA